MASYTPNYNLKKPADGDYYDIADDNGNMDKIDTALNTLNAKTIQNTESFSTLSALKTFLANMTTGKSVNIIASSEASSAICGSTYICSGIATKVDSNIVDINWVRANEGAGSTRYNASTQTFYINDLNPQIAQIEKRAKSTSLTLADGASMTVAQSNSAGLLIVKVTGQNIEYVAVHGFMYINQYAKNLGSAIYTYNYMGTVPATVEMASNGIKITNTSGKSVIVNALLLCESNAI